jgi:nucleolar pre-ribosomal-associated protein 2
VNAIYHVAITAFNERGVALDGEDIVSTESLETTTLAFKSHELVQLKHTLHKLSKRKITPSERMSQCLSTISIVDALSTLKIDSILLSDVQDDAQAFLSSIESNQLQVGKRLETFMKIYGPENNDKFEVVYDVTNTYERQSISERTRAAIAGKNNTQKLNLTWTLIGKELTGLNRLDKLLAMRYVIISIEGKLLALTSQ